MVQQSISLLVRFSVLFVTIVEVNVYFTKLNVLYSREKEQ